MEETTAVAEGVEIPNQVATKTKGDAKQVVVDTECISTPVSDKLEVGGKVRRRKAQHLHFKNLKMAMHKLRQKNKSHTSRFYKTVTDLFSINKGLQSARASRIKKPRKLRAATSSVVHGGLIHDTHLQHAGIYIHKRERCCDIGPDLNHERVKMFHFLESPKVQGALRLLLLIDLVVVCLEIFFLYRALPPSFEPDTDAASLYTPQYSMCSLATTNAEFTTCCGEVEKEYGRFSPFSSIEDCKAQHMNASIPGHNTHRLRQLLSSASNHHALPRCYRFPRNFRPHLKHYTVETMLHVLGSAICIVFLIEVNLMLWTVTGCRISKIPHMCCNCTQIIRLGDRVMLREDVELDGQDNLLQPNVVYCVRHVSAISGFVDLFEDEADTNVLKNIANVSNKVIKLFNKGICPCQWNHGAYAFDYLIVTFAFIVDVAAPIIGANYGDEILGVSLLLARSWRFIRVAHGVFEARHKYENAIAEAHEFEHDARDVLDEIDAYKNMLVLGNLSIEEFDKSVNAIFKSFLSEYPEELEEVDEDKHTIESMNHQLTFRYRDSHHE